MQTYEVQPGDSPARIAARFAGCPKCAIDLVHANPHKRTVAYPNGFHTFERLHVGERLALPDKWTNGDLDMRPATYFQALPYADGYTPSTLGLAAAGVLGDYAALDTATGKVGALAAMDGQTFSNSVGDAGAAIDASVQEAYGSSNAAAAKSAQDTQNGTHWAWQRNADLASALASGDTAAASTARSDIQNALSTALGNARLALQAYYAAPPITPPPPPSVSSFPATVAAAAQAAVAALAADSNYCASVARAGTPVNTAVHNFKTAWNASQSPPVPINTGNYEAATAAAVARVVGSAPTACGARPAPAPVSPPLPPQPVRPPTPVVTASTSTGGLSTGAVVGIGVLAAGAVGAVAVAASRKRGRR